jgi:hypothetical protein
VFSEETRRKLKSAPINLKFFEHHGVYYSTHAYGLRSAEGETEDGYLAVFIQK